MSLSSETTTRYSAQILINASNPQLSTATTLDQGRLDLSIVDVIGEFAIRGITYDTTDERHNAVAVPGVYAKMLVLTGQDDFNKWSEFLEWLDRLAQVTSRNRIIPTTTSRKLPTQDRIADLARYDEEVFRFYKTTTPADNPTQD